MKTLHKIGDTVYVFTDDRTLLITLITAVGFVPNTGNNGLHIVYNVLNENGDNNISFHEDDIYNSEEEAKERIILVETKDYEKRKAELNGEKFVEKEIDKKAYCSRANGDPYPPCYNSKWECKDCLEDYKKRHKTF